MGNELANIANVSMDIENKFYTTFDMESFGGKVRAQKAFASAMSLNDISEDIVLKINDVIITPGIRKGRGNAPDTNCQNTYLIDVEGNAYFTQSDGIARDINFIMYCFKDMGKETAPNGYLSIQIVSRELPNGNTIKNAVLIEDGQM